MNDERTKIIGKSGHEYPDNYDNLYKDAMAHEIDELAYLDEMPNGSRSRQWNEHTYVQPRSEWSQGEPIGSQPADDQWKQGGSWDVDEYEDVPAGNGRPPKKKKSKKGLVAIIILILLAIGAVAAYFLLSGEDAPIVPDPTPEPQAISIDLTQTMSEPKVTGFDGEGVLSDITLDSAKVDEIVNGIEDETQQNQVKIFFENVQYTADKTEELSAGDQVKIIADYDENLGQEAQITVTSCEYTYTVGEMEAKSKLEMPQWYKNIEVDGDEVIVTCLLLAKKGTKMDLPVGFMYTTKDGALAELVDTSGSPEMTYKGEGYYLEPGCESSTGNVTEIDENHVKYSVEHMGESYKITVEFNINDDGSITVTRADSGETPISIGTYSPIGANEAKQLGGTIH